jgi:hypothetical protein
MFKTLSPQLVVSSLHSSYESGSYEVQGKYHRRIVWRCVLKLGDAGAFIVHSLSVRTRGEDVLAIHVLAITSTTDPVYLDNEGNWVQKGRMVPGT